MTVHFTSADSKTLVEPAAKTLQNTRTSTPRKNGFYRTFCKRGLDISLSVISAPVVLPLVAFLAVLVAMDGRNPFYSQLRVGRNGKSFRLWKLRTMVQNADVLLDQYLKTHPAARAEWLATQKLKNDPRITWAGRFLRKFSLDELPQLWNVFIGDMSLVGPRPMMLCQKPDYRGQSYYRLSPGVTGLWQVSDRNESTFAKRVEYDDLYDETLSLKTDLSILLQTVSVVVRGTGY